MIVNPVSAEEALHSFNARVHAVPGKLGVCAVLCVSQYSQISRNIQRSWTQTQYCSSSFMSSSSSSSSNSSSRAPLNWTPCYGALEVSVLLLLLSASDVADLSNSLLKK